MRLAYRLARENVERNPGDNRLVDDLVIMTDRLARHLGSLGRHRRAVPGGRDPVHANLLVQSDPDVLRNRIVQGNVVQLQGELLMQAGRYEEADRILAEAERLSAAALARWPDDMELLDDRATTLSHLATLAIRRGTFTPRGNVAGSASAWPKPSYRKAAGRSRRSPRESEGSSAPAGPRG